MDTVLSCPGEHRGTVFCGAIVVFNAPWLDAKSKAIGSALIRNHYFKARIQQIHYGSQGFQRQWVIDGL